MTTTAKYGVVVGTVLYAYAWFDVVRGRYVLALIEGLAMFAMFLAASHDKPLDRA